MRVKFNCVAVCLVLCLLTFLMAGCGEKKSGSTIAEPEITGQYLQEEYSQQLLTDGAETVLGYITKDVTLGAEGRIACQDGKDLKVVTADEFIENYNDGEKQLYTVYLMGDSVELILATDPADVEVK